MLISVLIPCFNEKKTIEEIVTRINKLKNLNIEIIIIDDKSNDGTKEILQKKVKIGKKDTSKTLAKKILKEEHLLYPKALIKILPNL